MIQIRPDHDLTRSMALLLRLRCPVPIISTYVRVREELRRTAEARVWSVSMTQPELWSLLGRSDAEQDDLLRSGPSKQEKMLRDIQKQHLEWLSWHGFLAVRIEADMIRFTLEESVPSEVRLARMNALPTTEQPVATTKVMPTEAQISEGIG